MADATWVDAMSLDDLAAKGKAVVKLGGKQILLWRQGEKIHACNNRCPHEGYPLSEGTMSDGCILTCNWHNWKFDLESGETLVGGDHLRRYPVRLAGELIQVDVTDPPPETIRDRAIAGLKEAFEEHDYERIAREIARYEMAEGNPLDCVVRALEWAKDRTEGGTTHAQAAAPDWLLLRRSLGTESPDRMVPVLEVIGHLSWDARQELGPFPFAEGVAESFNSEAFEEAIEAEREAEAVRLVRRGLMDGGAEVVRPALRRASLRHYQSFGHSPIYAEKTYELMDHLGPQSYEPLVLPLVRALCMGQREDLIPEFRAYQPAIENWDGRGTDVPTARDFRGAGVRKCLQMISSASGRIPELVDVLFEASADAMLHYDPQFRVHTDKQIQHNVDWLDFTHALTHLNASIKICRDQPELWPNALLQTGCFLGRNTAFIDWDKSQAQWAVGEPEPLLDAVLDGMLDHGEPVYIFPAHTLKVATALREEHEARPNAPWIPTALAALNRYVHEPIKRKHSLRTVKQAMSFVQAQGG